MRIQAGDPDEYIEALPMDRKEQMQKIRNIILSHIPAGFQETVSYGMISYVVPHALYPSGYHVDPSLPLPFIHLASQKNFIALYHMGLYADKDLLEWLVKAYPTHSKTRLDMGKSCIRFKKVDQIPYTIIKELVAKMSVADWVNLYQKTKA